MSVGKKQEHTDLAASDLVNSSISQNGGWTDLVESLRMVEVPSQPDAKTVVDDMRQQEGSNSSRADRYRWAKIKIPEFRGGDKWSSYLVQFRTIMKMHGCYDNDVMVFKLVEAVRGPALEYYNS